MVHRPIPLRDPRSQCPHRGDGHCHGSGRPNVARHTDRLAAALLLPSSLPSPPPPPTAFSASSASSTPREAGDVTSATFPGIDCGGPQPPTTNCRRRCHHRCCPRQLPRAPPPSCCDVQSSAARLPCVVRPPPLVQSSTSSSPNTAPSAPSSSSLVFRRPPTAWQHCHRLIAVSSSSPLPLSPSHPLPALTPLDRFSRSTHPHRRFLCRMTGRRLWSA